MAVFPALMPAAASLKLGQAITSCGGLRILNLEIGMAHLAQPLSLHPQPPAALAPAQSPDGLRPDEGLAQRHRSALPWPEDVLTLFSLRMARLGMSISRVEMTHDARYALQQLLHARDMGDPALAVLAETLFRRFQAHQSGLPQHAH